MTALLEVEDLHAHYDKSHILHGVHLAIGAGEIVSLLGRNGSGRSTTLKTIMGLVRPSAGAVRLGGADLAGGGRSGSRAPASPTCPRSARSSPT